MSNWRKQSLRNAERKEEDNYWKGLGPRPSHWPKEEDEETLSRTDREGREDERTLSDSQSQNFQQGL